LLPQTQQQQPQPQQDGSVPPGLIMLAARNRSENNCRNNRYYLLVQRPSALNEAA